MPPSPVASSFLKSCASSLPAIFELSQESFLPKITPRQSPGNAGDPHAGHFRKAWVVARGQEYCTQKASAFPFRISNCGFRIFCGLRFSIRIPQSTIRNSDGPLVPWNRRRLMISACNALAPGPGTRGKDTWRWGHLTFTGLLLSKPPALSKVRIFSSILSSALSRRDSWAKLSGRRPSWVPGSW